MPRFELQQAVRELTAESRRMLLGYPAERLLSTIWHAQSGSDEHTFLDGDGAFGHARVGCAPSVLECRRRGAVTDFHSATLVGSDIVVVGGPGYPGTREPGVTRVYRLNTTTF